MSKPKDEEYVRVIVAFSVMTFSILGTGFAEDLGLPEAIGRVYGLLHLPFAIYYYARLVDIRNRDRAARLLEAAEYGKNRRKRKKSRR